MKRTLAAFAACCDGRLEGADAAFTGAVIDSRKLGVGDLFLALPGTRTDGHEFVGAAAAAGAAGAVVSRPVSAALPQVVVADVATALAAQVGMARGFRAPWPSPSNGKIRRECWRRSSGSGECLATRGVSTTSWACRSRSRACARAPQRGHRDRRQSGRGGRG
jgi:hypothetical protein